MSKPTSDRSDVTQPSANQPDLGQPAYGQPTADQLTAARSDVARFEAPVSIPAQSVSERMSDAEILETLHTVQAVRKGHFRLTSGRHSDTYIQCARVLEHPRLSMRLAAEAASRLPHDLGIDLVASPALGGILFGFALAAVLDVSLIFSERVAGEMTFRRSFEVPAHARVLIAEDVVTTGGSVAELEDLIIAQGGVVLGVVSLIDRGGTPRFRAPFYPLLRLQTPSWEPESCVLCAQGVDLIAPGSRNLAK
jgi:orotate phosphoribosyltransferase